MDFKIGVIGTGAIGQDHIRRINEVIKGAHVTAVADIDEKRAAALADRYGIINYKTGNEVIWSSHVDAVVICSSDPTHAGFVLECIKAGKYVLCEKPLGISAKECLEVVEAEIKCGKRLVQVGFMRRYDRGYNALKNALECGEIGAPLMVHCCHRNKVPGPMHTTDMTIKNSGIHEIDIFRWLLNEEYSEGQVFYGRQNRNAEGTLKDPQIMLLKTERGIRIDVEMNMNSSYGYDIQCEIVGEKGVLRLSDPSTILKKSSGSSSYEIFDDWSKRFIEAYDIEFQQWIESLKEGSPSGPSAWDGYMACVVADTLIEARNKGIMVPIISESKPEFYC